MVQQLLSTTLAPVLAQVNAVVERQDVLERRGSLSMLDSDAPNAVADAAEQRVGRLEDLGGVTVTRVAATNVEAAHMALAPAPTATAIGAPTPEPHTFTDRTRQPWSWWGAVSRSLR